MGRIQYAPTLPAGDVSYLYPQRLPRTPPLSFSDFPFSMYPCRGVLHTPHKRPGRGGFKTMGRAKFLPFDAYNMEGGGVTPLTPTSFSCLDTGKRMRKENQGITEAGEFSRVPGFFVVRFPFFVVPGRGVLNTPHKRPGRGGFKTMGRGKFLEAGAFNMKGGGVAPSPLHPFLVLIRGKGSEKKIKASGMPTKFPCPGRGRQGCRPIWLRPRPFRC